MKLVYAKMPQANAMKIPKMALLQAQRVMPSTPSAMRFGNMGGPNNGMGMGMAGSADTSMYGEQQIDYWEIKDRTSLQFTLHDKPGILNKALEVFGKNNINLTRINSRPEKITCGEERCFEFFVDFYGTF